MGSAKLSKHEHEKTFSFFPPHQLFTCLSLSRLLHYLRAKNRLRHCGLQGLDFQCILPWPRYLRHKVGPPLLCRHLFVRLRPRIHRSYRSARSPLRQLRLKLVSVYKSSSILPSIPAPVLHQPFMVCPGFSPIPAKLVSQIVPGKFVELNELLSSNIALNEPEPQLLFDGRSAC